MDIIAAYREAGTYRGAAEITGTTHKTVKRVIARDRGGRRVRRASRALRGHSYDGVAVLAAERVEKTQGRISAAKLGCCRRRGPRGMGGRRVTSAAWSRRKSRPGGGSITGAAARRCGRRVSIW